MKFYFCLFLCSVSDYEAGERTALGGHGLRQLGGAAGAGALHAAHLPDHRLQCVVADCSGGDRMPSAECMLGSRTVRSGVGSTVSDHDIFLSSIMQF